MWMQVLAVVCYGCKKDIHACIPRKITCRIEFHKKGWWIAKHDVHWEFGRDDKHLSLDNGSIYFTFFYCSLLPLIFCGNHPYHSHHYFNTTAHTSSLHKGGFKVTLHWILQVSKNRDVMHCKALHKDTWLYVQQKDYTSLEVAVLLTPHSTTLLDGQNNKLAVWLRVWGVA